MTYLSIQFILPMIAAVYCLFISSVVKTDGILHSLLFGLLPIILAFSLTLFAFKVI